MIQKKYYDGFMVADILHKHIDDNALYYRIIESFSKQPTAADVRENVKGHWVAIDDEPSEDFECDRCGNIIYGVLSEDDLDNFCSKCGADMRGEKDG